MKKQSDYTAVEWSKLFPDERYRIQQAEYDEALGRGPNSVHVRAADGRSSIIVNKATGAPAPAPLPRRIGGLV